MTVTKVIELVGESKQSWQEAVEMAVSEASKTIRNITGVHVKNMTANVANGAIVEYKADVEIAFPVEGTK